MNKTTTSKSDIQTATLGKSTMSKLRSIIVDDEPLARKLMRSYLSKFEQIHIIGECENGLDAIECISTEHPDIVFLDIQMPGINGLDVVKAVQSDIMPLVIFSTAYEQYALDAFDLHAVDYILKPIDAERLAIAVDKAIHLHHANFQENNEHPSEKYKLIEAITHIHFKSQRDNHPVIPTPIKEDPHKRTIAIKDTHTVAVVNEDDIDWVDAAGDYMCVHVHGKTHIMRSTMKDLQHKLDDSVFKRIHRSTIVNLTKIKEVTPLPKGEYFLHLKCDEKIKVSRNYRTIIKEFIQNTSI